MVLLLICSVSLASICETWPIPLIDELATGQIFQANFSYRNLLSFSNRVPPTLNFPALRIIDAKIAEATGVF